MYVKLNSKYSIIFSISIYLFLIHFFPNKMYWVDDWILLDELIFNENNITLFEIFRPLNKQLIILTKIFFFIDYSFFDLNPRIYEIFNVTVLSLSCIILLNYLKIKKIDELSLFIASLIFLNHTLLPVISQPINTAWILSVFLIIIFITQYSANNKKASFPVIISIVLGAITFSLSLIISLYLIVLISVKFFSKKLNKTDYLYFTVSIISLTIFFLTINAYEQNIKFNDNLSFNYLFSIFLNYFTVIGSFYIPWIKSFYPIAAIIGLIQTTIVLYICKQKIKTTSIYEVLLNNKMIVIGIFFAILTSFFRNEITQSISPRYSAGIIFFQIGFWILLVKNHEQLHLKNKYLKLILIFPILAYLNGLLSPYLGVHWQIQRSYNSEKIISCFIENKKNNEECYNYAYSKVFFNSKSFNYEKFKKIFYASIIK